MKRTFKVQRLALSLALLVGSAASAEELTLDFGVTVLLKVVSYDATFDTRAPGDFTVLVPEGPDKASTEEAMRTLAVVARSRLRNRALTFVAVNGSDLDKEIERKRAVAILALPDSGDAVLEQIAKAGAKAKIYTLGFGERAVQQGVAIGVRASKEGKPEILLNVPRAKTAGAEFPPSILKVARLIQ